MDHECAAGRTILSVYWSDGLRWTWPCDGNPVVRVDGLLDDPVWCCTRHGNSLLRNRERWPEWRRARLELTRALDETDPHTPTRIMQGPIVPGQLDEILALVEQGEVVLVDPPGVVFSPPKLWEKLKRGSARAD